MSTLLTLLFFLMRIEFVLNSVFFIFHQSQVVLIAVAGNKRKKCPFLKDKIYKKVLDFK